MRLFRISNNSVGGPAIRGAVAALLLALAAGPAPARDDGRIFDSAATEDAPGAAVAMTGELMFEPHSVTIQAGERIVWRNTSNVSHTVTLDPDEAIQDVTVAMPDGAEMFNSGMIEPGEACIRTLEVPGRYQYFCIPHQAAGMVGEVIVEEPDGG
jgi:plastocyanin